MSGPCSRCAERPPAWFWTILMVILAVVGFFAGQDKGYRAGQIDAANGKQTYHLTTQPDGSTKWEAKR